MKRKLDYTRLYFAIKRFVIGISIICIFLGFIRWGNLKESSSHIWEGEYQWCAARPEIKTFEQCIEKNAERVAELENSIIFLLLSGVFLPILFFGGISVFNYVFPKRYVTTSNKEFNERVEEALQEASKGNYGKEAQIEAQNAMMMLDAYGSKKQTDIRKNIIVAKEKK